MDSCDLNCRNILCTSSLQKHIVSGFPPKSTKTALKVNGINAAEGIRTGVRFLVPPTRNSMQHEFGYCCTLLTTTNHAFGPPSLNEMSFGSGRTSYRDDSMDSTFQPSAKATSISF